LTDEERHGQEVFTSAKTECATCHVPSTDYTNRTIPPLAQPGPQPGFVIEPDATFKTPSLLYVGGSPPYMHDGRYATLEELIDKNMDRMGKTTQLSDEDKKALVAFLKTL
jgi:cytochrome c peroxidase